MKTTTANYILLIIKSLIVFLFVYFLYRGISSIIEHFELTGDYNGISSVFYLITRFSYLHASIFLLIPMAGIFLKKKVGWALMTSYFYFVLTNAIFYFISDISTDFNYMLATFIIVSVIALIVIAMNKKEISHQKYQILPNTLLLHNIVAFVIGVCMTIFLVYFRS